MTTSLEIMKHISIKLYLQFFPYCVVPDVIFKIASARNLEISFNLFLPVFYNRFMALSLTRRHYD